MKREHVLSVLYDLTLTIGGEVRVEALLTKVLQRLLFHTSFPAGVVLTADAGQALPRLAAVVGDHTLTRRLGQVMALPTDWLAGDSELIDGVEQVAALQGGTRVYRHALKLPIAPEGSIVLLSPELPGSDLPLTQVFRPVLRNLAKAIGLCRHSEQLTQSLISDRDQARNDLALALQRSERERVFLRQLTDTFPDLVWLKDPAGVYLACNRAFERLYACPEAGILGKTDAHFVHPDLAQAIARHDEMALAASGPTVHEEWLSFAGDGYRGLFEFTKVPMHHADGRVLGVLGIAHDITQRRHDEAQLHLAASVFTHAREGIMITGADGLIIEVNNTFTEITGFERSEVVGKNSRILQSDIQGPDFYAGLWRSLQERGHWDGEIWNRRKNGEIYPQLLTISTVRDDLQQVQHYVALFSDISHIKAHERQLEHIAHYDALTSLPNRVLLADRLQQAMAQCHRRDQLLAVVYLDLDGFKLINDKHGHVVGDRFLSGLAARLKAALREGDTLARLGGDEFAAVFPDLGSEDVGAAVLARLVAATAEPIEVDDLSLQCTASIGVTYYPQPDAVDADQLLRQADQAMYQAKLAGKNRHHVFDPDQDRHLRGQHESLERMRLALERREFVLHYQPKVNMHTGEVVGAEALIRWQHPERGLLPPALFLPVIENHPLSIDLGDWVFDTALTQMQAWQAAGLNLQISVNLGAHELQDPAFVERLRRRLAQHPDVDPARVELEILETSALEDVRQIGQVLTACRHMGMSCALDDFGTGYASLSYLKRLPAQVLKIDQSFVRDMLDDPDDLAILEGVLGLANAFHRQAVAEGVESIEHGVMLLQLGCQLAQGFGIARPMPAADLPGWVAQWRPDARWLEASALPAEDLPVLYAGVEHRAWVLAVADYLAGQRNQPPVMDPGQSRFGEWLGHEHRTARGKRPQFQQVEQTHLLVHALAAELIALQAVGQTEQAQARLPELLALRDRLLKNLAGLRRWPGRAGELPSPA